MTTIVRRGATITISKILIRAGVPHIAIPIDLITLRQGAHGYHSDHGDRKAIAWEANSDHPDRNATSRGVNSDHKDPNAIADHEHSAKLDAIRLGPRARRAMLPT